MNEPLITEYLRRIHAARPERCDLDALTVLQDAHLRSVPFENLSVHLGEPVDLSQDALLEKIVTRRRGGFCYELNGAFALLLSALGYRVTLLAARVFNGEVPGPPLDHLTLRVDLAEPWLVDVGFGNFSRRPLRLAETAEQPDAMGVFRFVPAPREQTDVTLDGTPQYRLDRRAYDIEDFGPTCWWHQTSPRSVFTRSLICSLPTGTGRVSLSGDKLIRIVDGHREETRLESDAEIRAAYRDHFGITLARLPDPVPDPPA